MAPDDSLHKIPSRRLHLALLAMLVVFVLAWDLRAVLLDQQPSEADSHALQTLDLRKALDGDFPDLPLLSGYGLKGPVPALMSQPLLWLFPRIPQGVRLTAVLMHAVVILLCFFVGRRAGGGGAAGLLSALICAASPMVMGWGRLDYPAIFLASAVMGALAILVRPGPLSRWGALGLALVISGGLQCNLRLIIYLAVPLLLSLAWHLRRRLWRTPLLCAGLAVLTSLPFLLANLSSLSEYLDMATHEGSPLSEKLVMYLLLPGVLPLLATAVPGAWLAARGRPAEGMRTVSLLAGQVLGSLLLLLLVDAHARYIVPSLPAAAALAGAGAARLLERAGPGLARAAGLPAAGALLLVFLHLNLVEQPQIPRRDTWVGLLAPDTRPRDSLARAMDALGTRELLLVYDTDITLSRIERHVPLWGHGPRPPILLSVRDCLRAMEAGRPASVVLFRGGGAPLKPAVAGSQSWPVEALRDPNRTEMMGRVNWLITRKHRKVLLRINDPDEFTVDVMQIWPEPG